MKNILLFMWLFPLAVAAQNKAKDLETVLQTIPFKDGKVYYEKVYTTELSSSQMMANARKWIAKTFTDYKSVVKLDDTASRTMILKGISNVTSGSSVYHYGYTVDISFKDNKFKVSLYDVTIGYNYNQYPERRLEDEIEIIKNYKKGKTRSFGGVWGIDKASEVMEAIIIGLSDAIKTKREEF